uniref:CYP450 716-like protein n=1 Tax=Ginkgo biloba TaxID=3311 RepID=W0G4Z1_GINBI|nr:CYP450 716-like protein [Ginkgo biloba]
MVWSGETWDAAAFAVTLFLGFLLVISAFRYQYGRGRGRNAPPGTFGLPLIGETLEFLGCQRSGKPAEFFDTRINKYGEIFKTSIVGHPTAMFCSPAGNRLLFSNENKLVVSSWPSSVGKLFGKSILTATGDEAKRLRRMLMMFLRPEALQTFVGRVDLIARRHLADEWIGKEEVRVFPLMEHYTFSLACNLFASVDDEGEIAKLSHHFMVLLKGVLQIPIDLPGTRYNKAKHAASAIRRELQSIIDHRRIALAHGNASLEQDLMSYLLSNVDEEGKSLTDEEIKDNILQLFFASHDTSSATLTLLLKYLAEHPDCYERILKEQLEIAGSKAGGQLLEWEELQKMKYSWRAAQETLRMTPPVQGSFREAITDFTYGGFTIPRGWKCYWTVNSTHKKAEYFEDPEKFDPSRFEGAGPAPYTFVPFGGGHRMCPGNEFARMEMLVFLHNIAKSFKWELVDKDEKISVDPMPAPVNGLPIKLHHLESRD